MKTFVLPAPLRLCCHLRIEFRRYKLKIRNLTDHLHAKQQRIREVQQQQFQALRAQNNFIADLEQQVYAKTELLRATKGQAATKSAARAESQSAPLPPRHQASPLHITRLSPKGMFEWSNSQHL